MHQLDRGALAPRPPAQSYAPDDLAIVLDHHGAWIELQLREQREQRAALDLPVLPVDHNIHSRILRAASAGSASPHRGRIAATPCAARAFTGRARPEVEPR